MLTVLQGFLKELLLKAQRKCDDHKLDEYTAATVRAAAEHRSHTHDAAVTQRQHCSNDAVEQ